MTTQALARRCPQCGGPVNVPYGSAYVRCAHCGSTSFVDLSGTLLHKAIRPAVPRSRVPGRLVAAARSAGRRDAEVDEIDLIHEPVWELDLGRGLTLHIGARPAPDGRYARVTLAGGEPMLVDPAELGAADGWQDPELAPEAVEEVAARVTGRPVSVRGIRLVHRPIYRVGVRIGGRLSVIRVDAVSGDPLDADWAADPDGSKGVRLWRGAVAMVAAAALLPLPWSLGAVLLIGAAVVMADRA